MRQITWFVSSIAVLLSACGPVGSPSQRQADDVVETSDGYAYRASVRVQASGPEWQPIAENVVVIDVASGKLEMRYRSEIQMVPGQTRNDIFTARLSPLSAGNSLSQSKLSVRLSLAVAPPGFTIASGEPWWGADPGRLVQVPVRVHAASSVKPGNYSLTFGMIVNGVRVGELPCEIGVGASSGS